MIKGKKVNLRHVFRDDLQELSVLMNDIESKGEFVRIGMRSPVSLEKEFLENGLSSDVNEMFCILDGQGNLVGTIGHMHTAPYSTTRELGFSIYKKEYRGKGYASEAVKLLTNYLFGSRPINRVQICMPVAHAASEGVAKSCDFVYEGVVRGYIFNQGKFMDVKMYSMLRGEYEGCL